MSNVHFYWFAPTNGDGEFLGLARPQREPTQEYLIEVAQAAERAGSACQVEKWPRSNKQFLYPVGNRSVDEKLLQKTGKSIRIMHNLCF